MLKKNVAERVVFFSILANLYFNLYFSVKFDIHYKQKKSLILRVNTVIFHLSVKEFVFADADKQQALNLFLGIFLPLLEKRNIWELPSDYYLHHNTTLDLKASKTKKRLVLIHCLLSIV